MINIADQLIEFSNKVGGARNVYEGHVSLLVGGFLFDKSELPTDGNVLPAGTPIYADEESRTIMIHYAFKVTGAGTSTGFKVVKGFEGTRVKVGMFLMVAPTTESGTGQSYEVTAVDSSNEDYDVVTTSATATASKRWWVKTGRWKSRCRGIGGGVSSLCSLPRGRGASRGSMRKSSRCMREE